LSPVRPAKPGEEAAAERLDALVNGMFLDPPFRAGRYPAAVEADLEPWVHDGDAAVVGERHDLLGVNYYAPAFAQAGGVFGAEDADGPDDLPRTAMGFAVDQGGLGALLRRLRDGYGNPPVWITENGASYADPAPGAAGAIQDPERLGYLRDHLLAASRAVAEGCDLRGYFCWTLTDNWEWNKGYTQSFGLVAVDRATGRRIAKASLDAFGSWARANRVA
jgi:beta-glucosidase